MTLSQQRLDSAIDDLLALVQKIDGVRAEFEETLEEFRAPGEPGDTGHALAGRRAVEWFLLGRHSNVLQGVPLELALHGGVGTENELPDDDVLQALLSSFCGVFEVSDVRPGEGLWVRDLLAFGEHPVVEAEGSRALERGDVLVGRLFPTGGGLHRISRAAGVFRDPELVDALSADLDRARLERRGVVRLSQAQLETMFWRGRDQAVSEQQILAHARAVLARAGLEPEDVELVFEQLATTPFVAEPRVLGGEDAIGVVLDALAFETEIDLELARRALLEAWPLLAHPSVVTPAGATPDGVDVQDAVTSFERGRADGQDLEQLFRDLERNLQIDADEDSGEEDLAPDFPGVVGAMVEEFLWETERASGADAARARRGLTRLSAYGAPIGVFEELSARHLLSFGSVWLPEWGELAGAEDARQVLSALRAFCEWADEHHEVALKRAYEADVAALEDSLPRIAEANRQRVKTDDSTMGDVYVVERAGDGQMAVRDAGGDEHLVDVDAEIAVHLRPGDHVRADTTAGGELIVYCCYPPECAALQRMDED